MQLYSSKDQNDNDIFIAFTDVICHSISILWILSIKL